MTRNIFKGMKVPEKENDKITEWTPPVGELDLKEILKPVEYYEKRFHALLDEGINSFEDRKIAEYREEFRQYVESLDDMAGEESDLFSELCGLLALYKKYLKAKRANDGEGDDENRRQSRELIEVINSIMIPHTSVEAVLNAGFVIAHKEYALTMVEDEFNKKIKTFFADLKNYYTTTIEEYRKRR